MDIISIGISFIEILAIFLIYNVLINDNIFKGITKRIILSIATSSIYVLFIEVYDTDALNYFCRNVIFKFDDNK